MRPIGYPIRTGNATGRDMAMARLDLRYHTADVAHAMGLAGAPLDAPDDLPAGGCTSLTSTDYRRRPLPAQSTTTR